MVRGTGCHVLLKCKCADAGPDVPGPGPVWGAAQEKDLKEQAGRTDYEERQKTMERGAGTLRLTVTRAQQAGREA